MWQRRCKNCRRIKQFFRIGLSHNSLQAYYLTNFAMIQHHHWSLTELEDMVPFEREIYTKLLSNWIKEENQRQKEQEGKMRRG
jgi:hypothetical protein